MNERNTKGTRSGLATGIRAATLVVVVGTLAAVWHPLSGPREPQAGSNATEMSARTPDISEYFPSRFAAPETTEPQAPTF